MNWYQSLYFGKNAKERKDGLIRRLEEGGNPFGLWLIALPPDAANQLEIILPEEYRRRIPKKGEPMIVGLAYGRREARNLIAEIVGEVYQITGTPDVRHFFAAQET